MDCYNVDGIQSNTLREEIFAGINFREFFFGHCAEISIRELGSTEDSAGIYFRELNLTKDFAGINFRESALFKDFTGSKFSVCLEEYFSTTLIYGFENNLSKNWYFFTYTNDKIADGLEKT